RRLLADVEDIARRGAERGHVGGDGAGIEGGVAGPYRLVVALVRLEDGVAHGAGQVDASAKVAAAYGHLARGAGAEAGGGADEALLAVVHHVLVEGHRDGGGGRVIVETVGEQQERLARGPEAGGVGFDAGDRAAAARRRVDRVLDA